MDGSRSHRAAELAPARLSDAVEHGLEARAGAPIGIGIGGATDETRDAGQGSGGEHPLDVRAARHVLLGEGAVAGSNDRAGMEAMTTKHAGSSPSSIVINAAVENLCRIVRPLHNPYRVWSQSQSDSFSDSFRIRCAGTS